MRDTSTFECSTAHHACAHNTSMLLSPGLYALFRNANAFSLSSCNCSEALCYRSTLWASGGFRYWKTEITVFTFPFLKVTEAPIGSVTEGMSCIPNDSVSAFSEGAFDGPAVVAFKFSVEDFSSTYLNVFS